MIEHCRHYAAGAACRCCHNLAARRIFLAYGESVGINEATAFERLVVSLGMNIIAYSLAAYTESSGQHSLGLDSALYGSFHHFPYLMQIVPYTGVFIAVYVLPIACAVFLTFCLNVFDFRQRINRV